MIDFVISYTEEASSQTLDAHLDPKWFAPYANITRFAVPLDYEFPGDGALDFIPAGKQGPAYAGRVNSFNWRDFSSISAVAPCSKRRALVCASITTSFSSTAAPA